jgi:hypothetical protein
LGIRVEVGDEVETLTEEFRLVGRLVGVQNGIEAKVDEGVRGWFSVGIMPTRVSVGVGLRDGMKVRHARRI